MIKIQHFDTLDRAEFALHARLRDMSVGAAVDGPLVYRSGVFASPIPTAWVEMEEIFAGVPTVTLKGASEQAGVADRLASMLQPHHLEQMARLIRRVLEEDVFIRDIDLIFSESGVRPIDTDNYKRLSDPVGRILIKEWGSDSLDWIESLPQWIERITRHQMNLYPFIRREIASPRRITRARKREVFARLGLRHTPVVDLLKSCWGRLVGED